MKLFTMSLPRVIIVGGGPAGCAAAYALANKSVKVTVFERGQTGRDKACGDALIPSALELLSLFSINQERIKALGGRHYDRIDLYGRELLLWRVGNKNSAGWIMPRAIIDQEIRDVTAEHAMIQYETSVTDLITTLDGRLKLSLRYNDRRSDQVVCDAVILATGAMNQLSRKLGIHGKPSKALSISVYAAMQQPDALIFQFVDSCKPGYRWIFPVSEKIANVGVCVLNDKPKANPRLLGEELLRDYNATQLGRWRFGWGPMWSGMGHNWHHPSGIVSCGDAAGLVNPFTGEGITAALKSGEQAGKAIFGYLLGNRDLHNLEEYSHWVTEHFIQQYKSNPLWQTWNNLCGIHRQAGFVHPFF